MLKTLESSLYVWPFREHWTTKMIFFPSTDQGDFLFPGWIWSVVRSVNEILGKSVQMLLEKCSWLYPKHLWWVISHCLRSAMKTQLWQYLQTTRVAESACWRRPREEWWVSGLMIRLLRETAGTSPLPLIFCELEFLLSVQFRIECLFTCSQHIQTSVRMQLEPGKVVLAP